jgi:hypothetical protein
MKYEDYKKEGGYMSKQAFKAREKELKKEAIKTGFTMATARKEASKIFKITPETVTGNTPEELKTDIKSLEKFIDMGKKLPVPSKIKKLLNDILEAKKTKLKRLEKVV